MLFKLFRNNLYSVPLEDVSSTVLQTLLVGHLNAHLKVMVASAPVPLLPRCRLHLTLIILLSTLLVTQPNLLVI